jgi:hypothetical protein
MSYSSFGNVSRQAGYLKFILPHLPAAGGDYTDLHRLKYQKAFESVFI